jgi:hypothetical protein
VTARCPAGHELPGGTRQAPACPRCRRDTLIRHVMAVDGTLPACTAADAVDAVAANPAALRELASALAADPDMIRHGAPPAAGRLAAELIARGSVLAVPACARCGRNGRPLFRTPGGGMCKACTARVRTAACAACSEVKAVAGRDAAGQPICERCRRHARGHRTCGHCGRDASIAVRARDGAPDTCVSCYRLPSAVCSGCGRNRPCNFAGTGRPLCPSCSPKTTAPCARCGQDRPPAARWPEGPVCDTCYTAALRCRAPCAGCGQERRPVFPPGPDAVTCADCAGLPVISACSGCGTEDKLYEKGLCARCSLRRRATGILSAATGDVPSAMTPVLEAICAARNPRSALNWLRKGAGAAILADIGAGRTAATHEALDEHPRPRAAGFLRQVLTAGGVLDPRDEELARAEQWLASLLESLDSPEHRRLVRAFATWQVVRRLRHSARARPRHRTRTANARNSISEAARFLDWLSRRGTTLRQCRQADIDDWLASVSASAAESTRGFLDWAARHGHCPGFAFPARQRHAGPAISDSQRWEHATRLLCNDSIEPADRAAGCLVLLYGQNVTRIAALTISQVTRRDADVHIRLGKHDVPVPPALGAILDTLITDGKPYTGTGTPPAGKWLFPGLLPGQPITAERLSARLNAIGIPVRAARRAALTGLAAQVPAAVLADTLGVHPTTAVSWAHDAGSNWNRYAAELARNRDHQRGE